MRTISLLGSTGSIGQSTLKLVRSYPDHFQIQALAAGKNISLLAEQIIEFKPKYVSCLLEQDIANLKDMLKSAKHAQMDSIQFFYGQEGLKTLAQLESVSHVVCAVVGFAGLNATIEAIKHDKIIALANKESLVVAGTLIQEYLLKHPKAQILPVDSEHSALWQCLDQSKLNGTSLTPDYKKTLRKMILTASGGPFFLQKDLDLTSVSVEQALKHPSWSMGSKISIDSATMMNKGLELIEAHYLFDIDVAQLDVLVHPQSIVHCMLEYHDGSYVAHLSRADMQGPIAYALYHPKRLSNVLNSINWQKLGSLDFLPPDHERFPAISTALDALAAGPVFPAALNAANEIAVDAFLKSRIAFTDIVRTCQSVLDKCQTQSFSMTSLDDCFAINDWARQMASECLS